MGENSNPQDREKEEEKPPCNGCKKEKWCLHHIKHQDKYQHLCSSCLLLSHPHLFCPYCLQDLADALLICSTCPRSVHVACHRKAVAATLAAPLPTKEEPFRCLHCLNPNLEVVNLEMVGPARKKVKGGQNGCAVSVEDFVAAKVVLTAARVGRGVMRKVAAEAAEGAKMAAMEAVKAKKEAKEAINRALEVAKEEEDKKRRFFAARAPLVAPGKLNYEASACKFPPSASNLIPLTKSKIAGESNGPAR